MTPASETLERIGLRTPLLAAPMAGGPSTPELVIAAARAGCVGFLAGGYLTPQAMSEQIAVVRSAGVPFGVNLFVANPLPIEPDELARYAREIEAEADLYDLELADEQPVEDDDGWSEKVELLLADPPPLVSFTFAIPDRTVIRALQDAGSVVVQTVTSAVEARSAAEAGLDALVVQASCAGGHSATFTPRQPLGGEPLGELIAQVRQAVALPLIATGGLGTAQDVASIVRGGADAAMVGTVLLRAVESGASDTHKAAVADPARTGTVLTRAFTGRPARGLRNRFIERHEAQAPYGYPAVHHLTSPLRKAAAAAGDPENVHLWAGAGYAHATVEPVASILERLGSEL